MVKQKTTSDATETKYRWVQYKNPLIATWDDVKPGTVTINTSSGYTSSSFGGLWKKNSQARLCIANATSSNWYGAFGCWTTYGASTVPGYPNTTISTGYFDLYVNVTGLDFSTEYDGSGYSNSGAIIGSLAAAAGSPRYGVAASKANGTYIRTIKRPAEITAKDAITVSVWVNFSTWSIPISCTEGGGWNFEYGGGLRFPVYIASVGYKIAQSTVTSASLKNSWHMITGTMDKDNVKIYIDGQEKGTIATGSENGIGYASNYIFIGAEAAGNKVIPTSSSFAGKISDVRIYATALTAAQVADLYRRSMVVDASGNISPRGLS